VRILICNWKDLAHPRAGGAEVWTHGVASAWAAEGHEVTLACSSAPGLAPLDERDGVEIVRGGDYRWSVGAHARHVYAGYDGKFDVVIDEINTRPFFAPRWATNSRVVPVMHQVAREVWFRETPLPVAVMGRFVLEPAWLRAYRGLRVGATSASTAESLASYGITETFVVPMGSDLPAEPAAAAAKAAAPTFVFVGRMCRMKRPMDAINAFRIVQLDVPHARLLMIGTGPDESYVRRHAGAGVEMLGYVPAAERDDLVRTAHALVATSVREGWGLVVSEAAALGTGTIAYRVPGLIDSVTATGGVLVDPKIAALARAMTGVALDPSSAPVPTAVGTEFFSQTAARLLAEVESRTGV
jgi:glycosyltransferase involved in cell wall biosynthesis